MSKKYQIWRLSFPLIAIFANKGETVGLQTGPGWPRHSVGIQSFLEPVGTLLKGENLARAKELFSSTSIEKYH